MLSISNDLCRWRKRRVCFQNKDVIIRRHTDSIMTFHKITAYTVDYIIFNYCSLKTGYFYSSEEGRAMRDVSFQYRRHLQTYFRRQWFACGRDTIFMQRHDIHFIPNPISKMLGRPQLVQLLPKNKISDTVHLSVFHISFAERLRIYYRMLLVISHQGGYINKQ